uniref:Ankyrin repeat domain-containing protein SOWAHC-like n=1 Tax=Stegastes partitus TaxID=144197 RepID=A0A3B5AH42_9TELE
MFTMTECTQEAILSYLREKGGKVRNTDLIEHFKEVFPEEPEKKAAVRQSFKNYVDNVAFVKTEDGVKYVNLRKKFHEKVRYTAGAERTDGSREEPHAAGQQQTAPGSGYGTDSQVRVPHAFPTETIVRDKRDSRSEYLKEEENNVATKCVSGQPGSDSEEDEGHLDSLSGSEGNVTPKGSRKHFLDLDDDRASVTLDPVEHEWMMCASDGEWGSLQLLLTAEPSLILRKDFVTGFNCLHWAAKHGKPELIALIVNFAKQHNVPINVDVRSNTGYTPLHIAAMHNHMEVVKLLVGAYNADVDIRDYSGRKACQYLTDNVSMDIRDIIGAYEHSESQKADRRDEGRWRFSKVLQSNLKPLRLLHPSDCDSMDGEDRPREKPVRRNSSLSRMKPKLEKLRWRTSQIVQSVSFHSKDDLDSSKRGAFRSRPKTHFYD